jgi:hypothetical protein
MRGMMAGLTNKGVAKTIRKKGWGHTVAKLVEALCYKPEGHRFESRMR